MPEKLMARGQAQQLNLAGQQEKPIRELWSGSWAIAERGGFQSLLPPKEENFVHAIVLDRVKAALSSIEKPRVLEICAGPGLLSKKIAECSGADVVALDYADTKGASAPMVIANAEQLPFRSASFDLLVGVFALEYTNKGETFREVVRVLKEGRYAVMVLHKPGSAIEKTVENLKRINEERLRHFELFFEICEKNAADLPLPDAPKGIEPLISSYAKRLDDAKNVASYLGMGPADKKLLLEGTKRDWLAACEKEIRAERDIIGLRQHTLDAINNSYRDEAQIWEEFAHHGLEVTRVEKIADFGWIAVARKPESTH